MEIDVTIGKESLSLNVRDPYGFRTSGDSKSVIDFGSKQGVDMIGLEIDKLIPRMIRGVAGCESGCPADAQSLVREGFGRFELSYIEGGILSAVCGLDNGTKVSVRIFPEFE